jgi:hypothetical protein
MPATATCCQLLLVACLSCDNVCLQEMTPACTTSWALQAVGEQKNPEELLKSAPWPGLQLAALITSLKHLDVLADSLQLRFRTFQLISAARITLLLKRYHWTVHCSKPQLCATRCLSVDLYQWPIN